MFGNPSIQNVSVLDPDSKVSRCAHPNPTTYGRFSCAKSLLSIFPAQFSLFQAESAGRISTAYREYSQWWGILKILSSEEFSLSLFSSCVIIYVLALGLDVDGSGVPSSSRFQLFKVVAAQWRKEKIFHIGGVDSGGRCVMDRCVMDRCFVDFYL